MAQGLCGECAHLAPALDPIIRKAYLGQCTKIEWPYAINIPLTGVPTECDYFEKGKARVVVAAREEAAAAAAPARVTRVELYHSSAEAPGAQFPCDTGTALALAGQLHGKAATGMALISSRALSGMGPEEQELVLGMALGSGRPIQLSALGQSDWGFMEASAAKGATMSQRKFAVSVRLSSRSLGSGLPSMLPPIVRVLEGEGD